MEDYEKQANEFFQKLERLDASKKEVLKKNQKKSLSNADKEAKKIFFNECFPKEVDRDSADEWFSAACIFCLGQLEKKSAIQSAEEFFEKIDNLNSHALVALKRNCGNLLSEADARASTIFYSCLPKDARVAYDKWFAAACIHCLWKPDVENRVSLCEAIGKEYASGGISDSYLKRVFSLMDTPWGADKIMLDKYISIVKAMRSKGYAISGKDIIEDFIFWNSETKSAQTKWAKEIAKCKTGTIEQEE